MIEHSEIDAKRIAIRAFSPMLRAFLECSDEVQDAIVEMVEILESQDATPDEKEAAHSTIVEALFPKTHDGGLGIDLENHEDIHNGEAKTVLEHMKAQEETFADRLETLLREKEMTQQQLAEEIGVGQPAVSMMLARHCRPQRRTVEKIARALGVSVSDLWPKLE